MRHYETIFILKPNLADDLYQEILTKYTTIIEKEKGVVITVQEWGTQKLAYDVKKFDKGTYVLVEFCGPPQLNGELERNLKLDDRILLFQTVKLSDYADPQALLSKQEEARKAQEPEADEAEASQPTQPEKADDSQPVAADEAGEAQPPVAEGAPGEGPAAVEEEGTDKTEESASDDQGEKSNSEVKDGVS